MLPCGTPNSTSMGFDLASPIFTDVERSARYDLNQERAVSFMPYCVCSFFRSDACWTVSKAADRSKLRFHSYDASYRQIEPQIAVGYSQGARSSDYKILKALKNRRQSFDIIYINILCQKLTEIMRFKRKTLKSGCLSLLTIRSFSARDGLGLTVRVWLGFGLGGRLGLSILYQMPFSLLIICNSFVCRTISKV
eukprot:sb/3470954/